MLGAVLVHPDKREVFALAPEPIVKGDGAKKNDCERNAAKRLLSDVRREHPHLKRVVVEDGLASNGPHIKHLVRQGRAPVLPLGQGLPPSPIGDTQAVPDLPRGGLGDLVPGDCVRIPGRDGAL